MTPQRLGRKIREFTSQYSVSHDAQLR